MKKKKDRKRLLVRLENLISRVGPISVRLPSSGRRMWVGRHSVNGREEWYLGEVGALSREPLSSLSDRDLETLVASSRPADRPWLRCGRRVLLGADLVRIAAIGFDTAIVHLNDGKSAKVLTSYLSEPDLITKLADLAR